MEKFVHKETGEVVLVIGVFLPFRPAEFGKVLHRRLRKGDSQ